MREFTSCIKNLDERVEKQMDDMKKELKMDLVATKIRMTKTSDEMEK
jgi:hypothetical protein